MNSDNDREELDLLARQGRDQRQIQEAWSSRDLPDHGENWYRYIAYGSCKGAREGGSGRGKDNKLNRDYRIFS